MLVLPAFPLQTRSSFHFKTGLTMGRRDGASLSNGRKQRRSQVESPSPPVCLRVRDSREARRQRYGNGIEGLRQGKGRPGRDFLFQAECST